MIDLSGEEFGRHFTLSPILAGIFRKGMEGETGFPRVKKGILGGELQNEEDEGALSPGWMVSVG